MYKLLVMVFENYVLPPSQQYRSSDDDSRAIINYPKQAQKKE